MYAIYGAGGFGREVIPLVNRGVFFIDANKTGTINGYRVTSEDEFLSHPEPYFNIAIADWKIRKEIAERLMAAGAEPFCVIGEPFISLSLNTIGGGAIICPHSTITANATIGKFFHCNIYSYVAHDCKIGDYVTFAPRVNCNGNVTVEDYAYIGTGAFLRQGVTIGEGAVVGMGAVITKDVEPYTTVVGNPGRVLNANTDGKREQSRPGAVGAGAVSP